MGIERQARVITPLRRLQVAGLILLGQVVGCLCAAAVLSALGLASHLLPFLQSPTLGLFSYAVTMVVGPILCSWAFVKRSSVHPRPLVVCTISYVVAAGLFMWLVRLTDGSRQAVGAMILPMLVLVPLASILGSFTGSYLQPRPESRAG